MVVWRLEVLNPINPSEVLITLKGKNIADIQREWESRTGNSYMTTKKLYTLWNRKTSYFFRLYKDDPQMKKNYNTEKWKIPFEDTNDCAKLVAL